MENNLLDMRLKQLDDELSRYPPGDFTGRKNFPSAVFPPKILGEVFHDAPPPRGFLVTPLSKGAGPPYRFRVEASYAEFTPVLFGRARLPQMLTLSPGQALYAQVLMEWSIASTSYRFLKEDDTVETGEIWYKTGAYWIHSATLLVLNPGESVPADETFGRFETTPLSSPALETRNFYMGEVTRDGGFSTTNGVTSSVLLVTDSNSLQPQAQP